MHPALLPARLSQLPPTSMRIAKKAMDGNLPAFMAIRRIFDQPSFNKVELWAPVLVANLAADRMPTQHELDYESEDRLWPLALNAIVCAHNSLLFFTDKGVLQKLPKSSWADIWQMAWPWINFTSTFHDSLGALDSEKLYSAQVTLITQLRADSITAKLIDTTAGVRTVVARAVKFLFPGDYDVREYWDFSNGWELLGDIAIQSTEHLDELLDGFDTSLYGLAGTVVRHLDLVTENLGADGTDPPFFYIGLVYTQIATCSLPFTACLRSCGIVTSLTVMLRIFVDLDREIINPLDELFLPLLRDHLDGPRALAHAITAGLLEVLILSVTSTHKQTREDIEKLLVSFLPGSTVYRSVLECINDVIKEADRFVASWFRGKSIAEHWTSFCTLVEQRISFLDSDFTGESTCLQGCDAPRCNTVVNRAETRRCSNCQQVYYCSQACQKEDWRGRGHRTCCESLRLCIPNGLYICFIPLQFVRLPNSNPTHPDPFSRRDRLFLRDLVWHDYTLNRETITAKYQAANDASSDEHAFCVVFDYTRGELGISVRALTSQPEEYTADASLRQRTCVRAWKKHGVNSGLVIMRVSCGDNLREHLVWTH
ncbi:hypothetical protein B0H19DRAFT_1380211 [Mycena capillaripes]|nr:hypothetical protein B0H19DRAFT_1380211 [Mycena capillaripes]